MSNVISLYKPGETTVNPADEARAILFGQGAVMNALGDVPKSQADAFVQGPTSVSFDDETRKAAERLLSAPSNPEALLDKTSPDIAVVFGSDGLYMKQYFDKLSEWLKSGVYQPKQIVVLSGMCPAIRDLDIQYCNSEGVDPSGLSEADLAAQMIRTRLQGELIHIAPSDDSDDEPLNELGHRTWVKQTFRTPDGLEIILTNGKAVPRVLGFSRPTTESTLQEACELSLFKPGQVIHGITRPPHGMRMMLELAEQLTLSGITDTSMACMEIGVSPEVTVAYIAILHNKIERAHSALLYTERLKYVQAGTETTLFQEIINQIHDLALEAFEQIQLNSTNLISDNTPTNMLEMITHVLGAQTEARRDSVIPEFNDMESLDVFKDIARRLGIAEQRDTGIDNVVRPEDNYVFVSEGGTSTKIIEQIKLLQKTAHLPSAIILSGAKFRTQLKHFEIPELNDFTGQQHEGVDSEYKLQEAIGKQLVTSPSDKVLNFIYDLETKTVRQAADGENSDFKLLGYTKDGSPIIIVEYRKDNDLRLGPSGLIEVVAEFSKLFIANNETSSDQAVVMATSALYTPSHITELMNARIALKAKGITTKTALASYGVLDQNGPGTAQIVSEIKSILMFMARQSQK